MGRHIDPSNLKEHLTMTSSIPVKIHHVILNFLTFPIQLNVVYTLGKEFDLIL